MFTFQTVFHRTFQGFSKKEMIDKLQKHSYEVKQISVPANTNFYIRCRCYSVNDVLSKNRMTSRDIFNTLARTRNVIDKSVSTMRFLIEIHVMLILKAKKKTYFKGSYDKQSLTLVVISYEIYETREGSFHKFYRK